MDYLMPKLSLQKDSNGSIHPITRGITMLYSGTLVTKLLGLFSLKFYGIKYSNIFKQIYCYH